ncbi:MAG: tRNA (N(6)-L-threonylcarbamoyladenosine(37)-C(2))-methylthiotransferase MtaB [Spirochaetes bacterium]|nr:tRNA (N(6)-L-threonylcarbamoyladenosine(37)-C(2))-methylthiotransferase MtaB [Spirochaetota bacterium]
MQKTFSVKTLGCKLNQYESSLIAGILVENGWIARPFGENVDLVIINTCTVTNKSDKKCRNYIRQGANFSTAGRVLVTGCMVDRDSDYVARMPEVFAAVKNSDKEKINFIVNDFYNRSLFPEDKRIKNSNFDDNTGYNGFSNNGQYPLPFYRTRGLLKIQDGCDGKCSYCIVPAVRGLPVSRDFNEVLNHARTLIDSGCPELILTGITIGKYNSNSKSLADLIKKIVSLSGRFRIRITSIEPNHVSDELIGCLEFDKVCSHIHIPLQSGSDRILTLMKRPYSVMNYMNLVEKISRKNSDISIGTDLIIGFPGELEEDFLLTLKAVEEVKFSYVHQFTFSPRTGTPASLMCSCSLNEISDRSRRLRSLSAMISLNYRKKFLGRNLSSVIEKNKTRNGYKAVSSNYIKMEIKNSLLNTDKVGIITDVRLDSVEIGRTVGIV